MMRKLRRTKGFTLVELMIVVAIIGILAAIAIPNFLNFRLKAKTSEAKSNLGAVRSTEIAYFAEWNVYIAGGGMNPVPMIDRGANGGDQKVAWNANDAPAGANDGTQSRFTILGFAPEGSVFFSYELEDATDPHPLDGALDLSGFSAHAIGDLDGDGSTSDYMVTNYKTEITKSGAPF